MNNDNRRLKVTSDGLVIDVTEDSETKPIPFPKLEQEFFIEAVDSGSRLFQILPVKIQESTPKELGGIFTKAEAIKTIQRYRNKLKSDIAKPTQFALKDRINPELLKASSKHADNRAFPSEGWFLVVDDNLTHVSKRRGAIAVTDNYLTFNSWSETNEVFKQLNMTLPEDYTKHYKISHRVAK